MYNILLYYYIISYLIIFYYIDIKNLLKKYIYILYSSHYLRKKLKKKFWTFGKIFDTDLLYSKY